MKGSSSTSSSSGVRTLLWKSALLLAPLAVVGVPPVAQTVRMMASAERTVAGHAGVYDRALQGKFGALVAPGVSVLIAGDSRAQRQLVPAVFEARGEKAVNVATNAQDLVTFANALDRYGLPASVKVLLISTSVFQVNDGAIGGGFISTACLLNMTPRERTRVYLDRLGSPWSPLVFNFADGPPAPMSEAERREQGFLGIDKTLELPLPRVLLNEHPWYRNVRLDGARWRIFQQAIARVAATGREVVLIQPPVSPAWRAYTAGTFVEQAELTYAKMLAAAGAAWPRVRVLDFYTTLDSRLGNREFYDIQHLNRRGATLFSAMVADRVLGEGAPR